MSVIKSHSVGNGDMFYIDHNSDNFTIIDCCLRDDDDETILDADRSPHFTREFECSVN
jgi:hypothetical protein